MRLFCGKSAENLAEFEPSPEADNVSAAAIALAFAAGGSLRNCQTTAVQRRGLGSDAQSRDLRL
jgi:hypothetical protein